MKILIAPDSFKGSLTASQAAMAIEEGLLRHNPGYETIKIPLADGGEGTAEALCGATSGRMVEAVVKNPLMEDITACYTILGDGKTAVIEMAQASGLTLIDSKSRNPLFTTTYGVGQLIKDALDRGCRRFIIGLGGSATNDGGVGMMEALGVAFTSADGKRLPPGGGSLFTLTEIDLTHMDGRVSQSEFIAACDVVNPLCGPQGASVVFGPQKGASPHDVEVLDKGLQNYGNLLERLWGKPIASIPGAGAAGGLGAAVVTFLQGKIESGGEMVQRETGFVKRLKGSDLLITGEGRMDFQTLFGKTPYCAAVEAKKLGIPVIGLCGGIGELSPEFYEYFHSVFSLLKQPMSLDAASREAYPLLSDAAYRVIKLWDPEPGNA